MFSRVMFMVGLIVAGEAIFSLPFHVTRFFRPTLIEVFGLTNTELGAAQAAYGIVAMVAYFPGGLLADRFSIRSLMVLSLITTTAGGLYLSTFPAYQGSLVVWGFWGFTTVLMFWAALIRATRQWGGHTQQGMAFGILDGGRGLLAAGLASVMVLCFGLLLPDDVSSATIAQKAGALRVMIFVYCGITLGAAALVWFFVVEVKGLALSPEEEAAEHEHDIAEEGAASHIGSVARMPAIWFHAFIIICAYVGYKGFDNVALFAVEAYGVDEVEAAQMASWGAWMRPLAAIGAGFLGDRFRSSHVIIVCFAILAGSDLYFAFAEPSVGLGFILIGNTLLGGATIFALRGVYFALFEEARIPLAATGTAIGVVSLIGYTPDIFVSLVGGILLDANPGATGHQHFYMFLAAFSIAGILATLGFLWAVGRGSVIEKQLQTNRPF